MSQSHQSNWATNAVVWILNRFSFRTVNSTWRTLILILAILVFNSRNFIKIASAAPLLAVAGLLFACIAIWFIYAIWTDRPLLNDWETLQQRVGTAWRWFNRNPGSVGLLWAIFFGLLFTIDALLFHSYLLASFRKGMKQSRDVLVEIIIICIIAQAGWNALMHYMSPKKKKGSGH